MNDDFTVFDKGNARGIVSSVFKPLKALYDNLAGIFISDISNDSAHKLSPYITKANPQKAWPQGLLNIADSALFCHPGHPGAL
jgi:hypothetical protein